MQEKAADTVLNAAQVTAHSLAGQAADLASQSAPAYSWTGYFMGLALMFVMLALLWFGARVMKQKGALKLFGQTADFNVESRLSLGPRKHIIVVRYRGKRLLLGVTDHHINLLSEEELGEDEAVAAPPVNMPGGIGEKFKDMLHDFNKRK